MIVRMVLGYLDGARFVAVQAVLTNGGQRNVGSHDGSGKADMRTDAVCTRGNQMLLVDECYGNTLSKRRVICSLASGRDLIPWCEGPDKCWRVTTGEMAGVVRLAEQYSMCL